MRPGATKLVLNSNINEIDYKWLVVSTPLKILVNEKNYPSLWKNVWNHQPDKVPGPILYSTWSSWWLVIQLVSTLVFASLQPSTNAQGGLAKSWTSICTVQGGATSLYIIIGCCYTIVTVDQTTTNHRIHQVICVNLPNVSEHHLVLCKHLPDLGSGTWHQWKWLWTINLMRSAIFSLSRECNWKWFMALVFPVSEIKNKQQDMIASLWMLKSSHWGNADSTVIKPRSFDWG